MFICNVLFYISILFCVQPQKELPLDDDLETYLDALKRVSEFYKKNQDLVDFSGSFALFVTNVNLKHILDYNKNVTAALKKELKAIVENNKISIKTFSSISDDTLARQHRAIPNLFADINPWVKHLYPFTYTERVYTLKYPLTNILYNWDVYKKAVLNFKTLVPTPVLSNNCLASLAQYPINIKKRVLVCPLKDACNQALLYGTDYGYGLSHRVLWMVAGRFGRGCNILASREDKQLTEKLCAFAYTEILFNLKFNFDLGDLIYEFICACSLGGHAEFLQRAWFNITLNLQTTAGCFQKPGTENVSDADPGAINVCDHHSTSLTVCSLSIAVRYIIEKFKFYPI